MSQPANLHRLHNVQERQSRQSSETERDRLLTAHQVEQRLRVDSSTIYRMAADGRLPAVKVGRQWRFPAEGVDAVLAGAGDSGVSETLDRSHVQAVLDVSAAMLGVMMVATDMHGQPLSQVANPCPWFAARAQDEPTLTACIAEWRVMADDLDFAPHFQQGALGFECARALIRSGSELVGMVLAGGVAPEGPAAEGLYHLDATQRRAVLDALPKVSAALSSTGTPARPTTARTTADLST